MKLNASKWTEIGYWCGACIGGQKVLALRYGIPWDDANNRPVDYLFPRYLGRFTVSMAALVGRGAGQGFALTVRDP